MDLTIYCQIPDDDVFDLLEAIEIISDNKNYSELKKVINNPDPREVIMAYIAKQLHFITYQYKKVKNNVSGNY